MSDSKHAPLPYHIAPGIRGVSPSEPRIMDAESFPVCNIWDRISAAEEKATADLIVRACNNHEKLLAACEELVNGLCRGAPTSDGYTTYWFADSDNRVDKARAAIAKATE